MIPLPSVELLRERFDYDENTGVLTYKVSPKFSKVKVGDIAGSLTKRGDYYKIIIDKTTYMLHRIIWKLVTSQDPSELEVDHKNRDGNDNRFQNLRLVTAEQQEANKIKRGTAKCGRRFNARVLIEGQRVTLGCFDTEEEAHQAYQLKCKEVRGEYAPV